LIKFSSIRALTQSSAQVGFRDMPTGAARGSKTERGSPRRSVGKQHAGGVGQRGLWTDVQGSLLGSEQETAEVVVALPPTGGGTEYLSTKRSC
jgi:hypothetical protein